MTFTFNNNSSPNPLPTGVVVPCFFVAGPLQVWVSTGTITTPGAFGAMQFLGVTRNGVEIQEQGYFSELKSDYGGGEQGPPVDFEFLGESHTISLELGQYNTAVLTALERRMSVAVASRVRGTLVKCSAANFRVLLLSWSFARNYTNVFVTEAVTLSPLGTPAMFPRLTLTALDDLSNTDGMPWNSTYTVSGGVVT